MSNMESYSMCSLTKLTGHHHIVYFTVFSPNRENLAIVSSENTIEVWNVWSGELIKTLSVRSQGILCLVFSHNGEYLASGSWITMTINVWRISS